MAVIDAHLHVFTRASSEFPREISGNTPADREEPAEKLLEVMSENGVDQAVLTQIGGAEPEHHRYLLKCLADYPDRFRGIGLIPESLWTAPEDHMDSLAGEGAVIGFRLFEVGGPPDPLAEMDIRTFRSYPIWKHAAEKGYVIWLYSCARDAHQIPFLVQAFPNVRVVFNHLMVCPGEGTFSHDENGRPHIETPMPPLSRYATFGLHEYENVCVHLSGQYAFSHEEWPYLDLRSWHERLVRYFGPERLMWATDFPWILKDPGYGELTRVIDELLPELAAEDRAAIMGGTAGRVLRFPERE